MSVGPANPIDAPQAWDVVNLQGVDTPGRCKWSQWSRDTEWDVKTGKGAAGATETVKGLPPAKGSFTFYVWTSAHFAIWDRDILPRLKYDPTKNTKNANAIYHPVLADIDVDSVNIESIGSWEEVGLGEYSRTIEMLEFYPTPKKSVTSTPKGSDVQAKDPNTSPGTQPDPAIAKAQQELAAVAEEARKAFGG